MDDEDDEARIRARAYQLWEAANRPEGRDLEHWIVAQAELGRSFEPKPAPRPSEGEAPGAVLQDAADPAKVR